MNKIGGSLLVGDERAPALPWAFRLIGWLWLPGNLYGIISICLLAAGFNYSALMSIHGDGRLLIWVVASAWLGLFWAVLATGLMVMRRREVGRGTTSERVQVIVIAASAVGLIGAAFLT